MGRVLIEIPIAKNPRIIIAHVAGSGTAARTGAESAIMGNCGVPTGNPLIVGMGPVKGVSAASWIGGALIGSNALIMGFRAAGTCAATGAAARANWGVG